MGFFSKALGFLGGGSSSSGGSVSGGFNALPLELQEPYKEFGTEITDLIKGGNLSKYTTPTPLSAGEQSAIEKLFAGFAPTSQSIGSDIAMQTNPFDSYVIDEINRQSQGDYSVLKSFYDNAGQTNSNRQMLGANDIDLSRLNQIGSFKQSQYDKALNNALTTLPQARGEDAMAALTGGTYSRNIDSATNMAPITALQELAKALGILPTAEGSSSSFSKSTSTNKGIMDFL